MTSGFHVRKLLLGCDSARVKSIKIVVHASSPLICSALHSGRVEFRPLEKNLKDSEQTGERGLIRRKVSSEPLRTLIVANESVFVAGDDGFVYICNLNQANLQSDDSWQSVDIATSHNGVRSLVAHPMKKGFFASCGDGTVVYYSWNADKSFWQLEDSHNKHFLMAMSVDVAPLPENVIDPAIRVVSASQDLTVVLWNVSANTFNTLENGHLAGLNAAKFHHNPLQPLLLTAADDGSVALWNYKSMQLIQHIDTAAESCVSAVLFSKSLPLFFVASEDNSLRVYKLSNYRQVSVFKTASEKVTGRKNMGRAWCIDEFEDGILAVGYDKGMHAYNIGSGEPLFSFDSRNKLTYITDQKIFQLSIQKDRLSIQTTHPKPLSTLDYDDVSGLSVSKNGKLITIWTERQTFSVHSSLAFRSQLISSSTVCPVFSEDSNFIYFVENDSLSCYSCSTFKEISKHSLGLSVDRIIPGPMIAVVASSSAHTDKPNTNYSKTLFFTLQQNSYGHQLKQQTSIEFMANNIYWNDLSNRALICCDTKCFFVEYLTEDHPNTSTNRFKVLHKFDKACSSAFFYDSSTLFINFGSSTSCLFNHQKGIELTILDISIEGTILSFSDKSTMITASFLENSAQPEVKQISFDLSIIEFKKLCLEDQYEEAKEIFQKVSVEQQESAFQFLKQNNLLEIFLEDIKDRSKKCFAAMRLGRFDQALSLCQNEQDFQNLAFYTLDEDKEMFLKALRQLKQPSTMTVELLVLLSLPNNTEKLQSFAEKCIELGQNHLLLIVYLHTGNVDGFWQLLNENNQHYGALTALFSRSYCSEKVQLSVESWREKLKQANCDFAANTIADPENFPNLF